MPRKAGSIGEQIETLLTKKPKAPAIDPANPCAGCPCEGHPKIKPVIPPTPKIIAIGMAPGAVEEIEGRPWVGPAGSMLQIALQEAGFDLQTDVGWANLARCRPINDEFDTAAWKQAERRCWTYLERDLQGYAGPVVLFGNRPLQKFFGDPKTKIGQYRGLWIKGKPLPLDAFVARHPAQILRTKPAPFKKTLEAQFATDMQRMAERVLGGTPAMPFEVTIYRDPWEAQPFLAKLAQHRYPWAADIETYDGAEFPSRREVSTDPCHPDFRVHGIAFAWGPTKGAYLVLKGLEDRQAEIRALLAPVFGSRAVKRFFNGVFDHEGLVFSGWVPTIVNRTEDGMMALIALGDGRHESLRLEKAVTDILHWPQYWQEMDKSRMRDLPIEVIAQGAVGDACATWALCQVLGERIKAAKYL